MKKIWCIISHYTVYLSSTPDACRSLNSNFYNKSNPNFHISFYSIVMLGSIIRNRFHDDFMIFILLSCLPYFSFLVFFISSSLLSFLPSLFLFFLIYESSHLIPCLIRSCHVLPASHRGSHSILHKATTGRRALPTSQQDPPQGYKRL